MGMLNIFLTIIMLLGPKVLKAQSLAEDANLAASSTGASENVFNETIKIISSSKKIFVITNNSQQLGQGDFISLALDEKLAARALVGKIHQGQVGIKILKIYSLSQWGKLKRDLEVQIIKGDDSLFGKKPEIKKEEMAKIKSEEDLYTGDVVEDDIENFDENKNRHIKPDNIVAVFGSYVDAPEVESKGGTVRASLLGATWAYQFTDNFFAEGLYGRALLDNYPADGAQTLINQFVARVKYNFKGPLYTFFMPYAGFQNVSVSSPEAGKSDDPFLNQEENDLIDNLQKSGPVFGLTVMRRLVPGWFIRADIGTDMLNLGFAIEF